MKLRRHQQAVEDFAVVVRELAQAGMEYPRELIAAVTPGGGKSALPVILAREFISAVCDRVCWVVPRASLREQGEAEFVDPRWGTTLRLRATANGVDLARGTQGYITTYQAIATDPGVHAEEHARHTYCLFLDEPHHVLEGGEWHRALQPLVDRAAFIVYASGTLERGDRQWIAFVSDAEERGVPVISYGRSDGLAETAIVDVVPHLVDGRAEWESEGEHHEVEYLSEARDDRADAIYTALRTEFAEHLLDTAIAHWADYRRETLPDAKLLVVAPDIATARRYLQHVRRRRISAMIATSDDSQAAQAAIRRFRDGHDLDALVTVAMAYEGLSVPRITHIACLTHIRSKPWLEQCFARANRLYPGKTQGHVFAPADAVFRRAVQLIESETRLAAQIREERELRDDGESQGGGRERVSPIASEAFGDRVDLDTVEVPAPESSGLTPAQEERLIRKNINAHVKQFLDCKRPGSKHLWQKRAWRRVREVGGGKRLADQSVSDLVSVWGVLREEFPCS